MHLTKVIFLAMFASLVLAAPIPDAHPEGIAVAAIKAKRAEAAAAAPAAVYGYYYYYKRR
jgi:hypothetical protein